MNTLFMASLPLDPKKLRQWAAKRRYGLDEGRTLHHLLAETFGKRALQPFRVMMAPRASCGSLYAYTTVDAGELGRIARETGMPDSISVCDPNELATKPMPTDWKPGRRLGFDLRARPVRRLSSATGGLKKGAEIDAFRAECLRRFPDGPPEEGRVDRETVYRDWLSERLSGAASLESVTIAKFERTVVQRGASTIEGPDVTFHGILAVTDGLAFGERLARGVGRHAAFGYGMLLLRPAR